jgi:hypothetical protein
MKIANYLNMFSQEFKGANHADDPEKRKVLIGCEKSSIINHQLYLS